MNTISQVLPPVNGEALLISSLNENPIEEYLTWKQSYTSTAFVRYKLWINRFQDFVGKTPEQMSHTDYDAFSISLRERYSPSCVRHAMSIVHNYLRFCSEKGQLRFPLYLARIPRAYTRSRIAISEGEYQTILTAMRENKAVPLRDIVILMILHDTGMRIGEAISLNIEDIEGDKSAVVRTEKTMRYRRVYWNEETDRVIRRYLTERIDKGTADVEALFLGSYNGGRFRLEKGVFQKKLQKTVQRCGLKRELSCHSFRHSFIQRLAKLCVPDAIIAQLVGHQNPSSIVHYTKLNRPELKEFATRQLLFANEQVP